MGKVCPLSPLASFVTATKSLTMKQARYVDIGTLFAKVTVLSPCFGLFGSIACEYKFCQLLVFNYFPYKNTNYAP